MKFATYLVPILFPIIAVGWSAIGVATNTYFRGDQSLTPLFVTIAIVSGGTAFANFLGKATLSRSPASAIGYVVLAILAGAFAAVISVLIGYITLLLVPVGRF